MYCPSCGAEFTNGLKFCKRCGANLNSVKKTQETGLDLGKFASMFWSIGVFGMTGLALLVGGLLGAMGIGVKSDAVVVVAIFMLMTILAIAGMLTFQLSRLIKLANDMQFESREFDIERTPAQIEESPLGMPSVTEHTTRNMEPSKFKETVVRK